jgi:predicted alpha/beta superfamily hydrolase
VTNISMPRVSAVLLAFVLLALSTSSSALDTRFLQGVDNSHYVRMQSETIGRDFHLFIMLPDDYDEYPERSYPTVYILDGGALFPLLAAYYRYLNFGQEIPDAITVGISYGSDSYEGGNYRSTDYTAEADEREYWGGAGNFQIFLRDELIPYVERSYRSRPDRRILFGQSIGGQFVLYTALTKPDFFWGHIASNPALHRNLPFFLQAQGAGDPKRKSSRLFVASGSDDDPEFRSPALEWIEHWSKNDDAPWHLKTMILDGHSHMSAPPASYRQGMRWLFSPRQLDARSWP